MKDLFHKIAQKTSNAVGSAWVFIAAVLIIVAWAASGPIFHFSDTWQLVINTGTTIVTFLMVFLIQNTQNRDAKVIHLKLDELIRVTGKARNHLVDLEDLEEEELDRLEKEFQRLRERDDSRRRKAGRPGKD
jgi:low affinity Fe/Cu permease